MELTTRNRYKDRGFSDRGLRDLVERRYQALNEVEGSSEENPGPAARSADDCGRTSAICPVTLPASIEPRVINLNVRTNVIRNRSRAVTMACRTVAERSA
jgi:hypothetical protein